MKSLVIITFIYKGVYLRAENFGLYFLMMTLLVLKSAKSVLSGTAFPFRK